MEGTAFGKINLFSYKALPLARFRNHAWRRKKASTKEGSCHINKYVVPGIWCQGQTVSPCSLGPCGLRCEDEEQQPVTVTQEDLELQTLDHSPGCVFVALDKLLNLSRLQFPPLADGDSKGISCCLEGEKTSSL